MSRITIYVTLSFLFNLPLQAQIAFTNQTQAAGIPELRSESIAVGDFNNDGWPDAYVTFGSGPNQLLQNDGQGGFVDVAPGLALDFGAEENTRVAAWGDFNNDGWLDLYLGSREAPNFLYFNNGDGTFTDHSNSAGIQQPSAPKSINLLDYDNDGWLDIYVSNFNRQNVLLHNNGDRTFTDVTLSSGATDSGTSMGVICFDYGQDGDQDMLLIKDANQPNLFYENNGDGTFTNIAADIGLNTQSFGMGADVADLNGDGLLDIYVTNLNDNFLFIAQPDGTYQEVGTAAGVDDPGMGWGTVFLDLENDGRPDLYLANEYSFSPYENKIYHNEGDGTFEDVLEFESIANEYSSWGCATLDQDRDGRQDLLVANRNPGEQLQYFRNTSSGGNFLQLKLHGIESNRMAIGARLRLVDNLGRIHYQELDAGCSWQSQNGSILHFGLGEAESFTEATIFWPSGLQQEVTGLLVNEIYTIVEGGEPIVGLTNEVAVSVFETEAANAPEFSIFPNPVGAEGIRLELDESLATSLAKKGQVRIMDAHGKQIFQRDFDSRHLHQNQLNIPTSEMKTGLFWVILTTEAGQFTRRLIVK